MYVCVNMRMSNIWGPNAPLPHSLQGYLHTPQMRGILAGPLTLGEGPEDPVADALGPCATTYYSTCRCV